MSLFEKIIANIKKMYTEHFLHWIGVKIVLFLILCGMIAIVGIIVVVMIWSSYTSEASYFSTQHEEDVMEYSSDSSASNIFQMPKSSLKSRDDDNKYDDVSLSSFREILNSRPPKDTDSELTKFLTDIFTGLGVVGWLGMFVGIIAIFLICVLGGTFFTVGLIRLNLAYQKGKPITISEICSQSIGRLFRQTGVGFLITLMIAGCIVLVVIAGFVLVAITGVISYWLSLLVTILCVIAGIALVIRLSFSYMLYLYPGEDTDSFPNIRALKSFSIGKQLMSGSMGKVFFPFLGGALIFLIPAVFIQKLPSLLGWLSLAFGDGNLFIIFHENLIVEIVCEMVSSLLFGGLMLTLLTTIYLHLMEEKKHLFALAGGISTPTENTGASEISANISSENTVEKGEDTTAESEQIPQNLNTPKKKNNDNTQEEESSLRSKM